MDSTTYANGITGSVPPLNPNTIYIVGAAELTCPVPPLSRAPT